MTQLSKDGVSPCSATATLRELDETSGTPSYYVEEDYRAGPEIQQPHSRLMSMLGATQSYWCKSEKKKMN